MTLFSTSIHALRSIPSVQLCLRRTNVLAQGSGQFCESKNPQALFQPISFVISPVDDGDDAREQEGAFRGKVEKRGREDEKWSESGERPNLEPKFVKGSERKCPC